MGSSVATFCSDLSALLGGQVEMEASATNRELAAIVLSSCQKHETENIARRNSVG